MMKVWLVKQTGYSFTGKGDMCDQLLQTTQYFDSLEKTVEHLANIKQSSFYIGHNGEVYPQVKLEEIEVR